MSAQDLSNLGAIAMNMILDGQPRRIPVLGDEVDLTFNDELNRAIEPSCLLPLWRPLSSLIDKQLPYVTHYAHAVNASLEQLVAYRDQTWLIYSGGAASIWSGAEEFARVQALYDIGAIKALPKGKVLGLAALQSCGWVNAFEKLCVVCNRPGEISQTGKESDTEGVCTQVTWRDGQTCQFIYT